MNAVDKRWIDNATYIQLLRRKRFPPPDDPLAEGDTHEYFVKVLAARRKQVGDAVHVVASRVIGWPGGRKGGVCE